LVITPAFLAKD